MLSLSNDDLEAEIDPDHGADVLSLVHKASGVNVLFATPWRTRAEQIRAGARAVSTFNSAASWLEQYMGGWQTLCPNAGPPRRLHGAPAGFHGEASVIPWLVSESCFNSATLRAELFSVPILLERHLSLEGAKMRSVDTVTNLSSVPIELDYVSHPALGGAFLAGHCTIETGARRFISDPETHGGLAKPSSIHTWPWILDRDGALIDMRQIPRPTEPRAVFGWLADFSDHWVEITNDELNLGVRLDWDGTHLPYAWLWQELNGTAEFPWFRRARVLAVEPSSTPTSGPDRRSVLRLAPEQAVQISIALSIFSGNRGGHVDG